MKKFYFFFALTWLSTVCLNAQYTGGIGSGYDMSSTGQFYMLSFELEGEGAVEVKVDAVLVEPEPAGSDNYLLEEGTVATITAEPDAGWAFGHWVGDAVPVGEETELEITVTMDEAAYITAKFLKEITITVSDASRIYGELEGDYSFEDFSDQLLTGDDIADVTGGTGEHDDVDYTFETTNINSDAGFYEDEISIDPASLNGPKAGDYYAEFIMGGLTINKRVLTVTADDKSKVYDGVLFDEFTVSYDGFADGDDENDLGGELDFSGDAVGATNAGTYTITPEGLTSDNYDIGFVDGELEITKKDLIVTAEDKGKIYDGEPFDEGLFTVAYDGFVTGEGEEVLGGELSFSGNAVGATNAGTYTITPEGLTSNNYAITFMNGELEIAKKGLTITANNILKIEGFQYDFDETHPSDDFSVSGLVSGDAVESVTLESAGADAGAGTGDYDIFVSDAIGTGLDNYNIDYVTGTLTVTDKFVLTLPDVVVENKTYDGDNEAVVSDWGELSGIMEGYEKVYLDHSEAIVVFEDKDAGENKIIIITGLKLYGDDAENYELTTPTPVADIFKAELTIGGSFTAHDKTYDGTVDATVNENNLTLVGVVVGEEEDIALINVNVEFLDTDVNEEILVFIESADITGDAAHNYTVTVDGAPTTQADITKKDLLVINAEAQNKTYDGSNLAQITGAELQGLIDVEEDVVLENHTTGYFVQVSVGVNIGVTTPTMTITGSDADNYDLVLPDYLQADITPKELTLSNFVADSKTYDGTTDVLSGDGFDDNRLPGDELEFDYNVAFENKNVGEDKTIFFTDIEISGGADKDNYNLITTNGEATASVTQKELTIGGSFTVLDKVYDGTTDADIDEYNIGLVGVVGEEDVTLVDVITAFTEPGPGMGIPVEIVNAAIDGTDKGNYTLSFEGAPTTTADIFRPTAVLALKIEGGGSVLINDNSYFAGEQDITLYKDSLYTIEATGSAGWEFSHWEGDVGDVDEAVSDILMDDDKGLTVHFTESEYLLDITVEGEGAVVKNPDKPFYLYDEVVNLTATANEGWLFKGWGGDLAGSSNDAVILMDSDKEVTATFVEQATLTITISGEGSVVVKKGQQELSSDNGTYTVEAGTKVTLEAIPGDEWTFSKWQGPDAADLENASLFKTAITMDGDKSIEAVFDHPNIVEIAGTGNIKLYPNPARNTINLEIENSDKLLAVEIINSHGQVVIEKPYESSTGLLIESIDVSSLHKGLYYMNIVTKRGSVSKVFVIQ